MSPSTRLSSCNPTDKLRWKCTARKLGSLGSAMWSRHKGTILCATRSRNFPLDTPKWHVTSKKRHVSDVGTFNRMNFPQILEPPAPIRYRYRHQEVRGVSLPRGKNAETDRKKWVFPTDTGVEDYETCRALRVYCTCAR